MHNSMDRMVRGTLLGTAGGQHGGTSPPCQSGPFSRGHEVREISGTSKNSNERFTELREAKRRVLRLHRPVDAIAVRKN